MRPRRKPPPEPSALSQNLRHTIKSCVRSGHWTEAQRDVLKLLLEDVNKYGRLAAPQHKLLLVLAKRCGVSQ